MDERWERLKSILGEALDQPSHDTRTALLKERCAEDAALLREAESLLAEAELLDAQPTDWVENCAEQATRAFWDDELSRVGQRLGAYAIVRELGRGGMGTVYLAARADGQFKKEVAIKVLKRGTDTDEILHRFSVERQIVARLEHPNIARSARCRHDGRRAALLRDGVCRRRAGDAVRVRTHQLSLEAAAEAFRENLRCGRSGASRRVIHRDLKPRNILVTADGEPKLLDFGIAKLLEVRRREFEATIDRSAASHSELCLAGAGARGRCSRPASDVYALGALLYELLTGQGPHRFSDRASGPRRSSPGGLRKEPRPPSEAVEETANAAAAAGALDDIVLRAMRKDPAARYSSAAHFAEDMRAVFEWRVCASSPRVARFWLRKSLARLCAAAAVLLLIAGGAASWFLRRWRAILRCSQRKMRRALLHRSPGKSIAVLPFENLSLEEEGMPFSRSGCRTRS